MTALQFANAPIGKHFPEHVWRGVTEAIYCPNGRTEVGGYSPLGLAIQLAGYDTVGCAPRAPDGWRVSCLLPYILGTNRRGALTRQWLSVVKKADTFIRAWERDHGDWAENIPAWMISK